MLRQAGIDLATLPEGDYDAPMGQYSGAGTIFGATGGVMEAALRTVYAVVTGKDLPKLEIDAVRGLDGIKEAGLVIGDLGEVRAAVAHGLGNARTIMDQIAAGRLIIILSKSWPVRAGVWGRRAAPAGQQ
jgi:iron only hydrogenase large subunit-like protein